MNKLNTQDVVQYVENHIGEFHTARIESLVKLKLKKILIKKNPYLFKAKNILTSEMFVKTILDAYLSSQEETMFGNFLEGLAIFIAGKVYDGKKSTSEGIDLEFEKEGTRYIVAIKSGPNWGNSSQITKMKDNFRKAKKIFATSGNTQNIIAINGCCYGRDNNPTKDEYQKLCGQNFWEFISGEKNLYIDIVEPLGHRAKEKNDEFSKSYAQLINKFTAEFTTEYCQNGVIDWEEIVKLNSSAEIKEEDTVDVEEELEVKEN